METVGCAVSFWCSEPKSSQLSLGVPRQACSTTDGFFEYGLKDVAMSLARRGLNLMQINRSILLRGSYANIGDYVALTKPRVMSLVVFTALVGFMVAPGGIDPFAGVVALLCIAAGAGAAGALNMWYDADIDAVMARTAMRPIPGGRVSRSEALVFGLMLGMCAILALGTLLNMAAAALLAFTIFFYVVVYTMWLKRRTPQNIVIGGAAGALPPVIGWGGGAGKVGGGTAILFPDHFPLDATPLLGTVAQSCRRICSRRCADVAGRSRQGRNKAPDSSV